MKKINLFLIQVFFFAFLDSCTFPEDTTKSEDNMNLAYSIILKANECGNSPNYPLYVASGSAKPAKRDMQACALTIIQQKCPFTNYPYYCIKIFKNIKFDIDLDFKNPFDDKED